MVLPSHGATGKFSGKCLKEAGRGPGPSGWLLDPLGKSFSWFLHAGGGGGGKEAPTIRSGPVPCCGNKRGDKWKAFFNPEKQDTVHCKLNYF